MVMRFYPSYAIHVVVLGVFLSTSAVPFARAGTVADLAADWSDTNNPNTTSFGSWSYLQATTLLPHVSDWTPLGASTPQPAWAPGNVTGNYLPAEFKATSDQFGWQTGDVIVHTTDPDNGASSGPANFLWTSSMAGAVTISGDVFEGRSTVGRDNVWTLIVNGVAISSGVLIAGDGHDRSNPYLFSDGTGGTAALTLNVSAGSTIDLEVAKTDGSANGDFVGVSLQISSVPEPGSFVMVGIAGTCLALFGLSRSRYRGNVV